MGERKDARTQWKGDSRLRGNDVRGVRDMAGGEWGNAKAQGRNERGDSRLRGNDVMMKELVNDV